MHGNYLERLRIEREKQLKALTEAELIIEKMRKIYIKARQQRLIVTKLREQKELQWKKDGLKQQDLVLDDLINAREYRKKNSGKKHICSISRARIEQLPKFIFCSVV